jgi:glycosyltransferase involved in cell wall biosynthesis
MPGEPILIIDDEVLVSVIVPCYNEQATIRLLLDAVYQQDFPRQEMEVVIADGLSTDTTRFEIETFQNAHTDLVVRVVDNQRRTIPAGLNQALACARGRYIIRLDAHSVPRINYISGCVKALEAGAGESVGGVWEIQPARNNWVARSIAAAAAHPLGVGDAHYRYTDHAQSVDTVPFGAFRRELVERIGGFDETLLTNEDYEFNVRVRRGGGRIWLDPQIRSTYFARPTFTALAQQYWRYGYWKGRMLIRYPGTVRWRQALPPLFVAGVLVLFLMTPWLLLARWVLGMIIALYLLTLISASVRPAMKSGDPRLLLGIPFSIGIMHFSWGAAFIWSLLSYPFVKK